jgi:histidyl-tRNA synthetase
VPYVVFAGEDEQARGVVRVRDLAAGDERDVPRAELAATLAGLLKG